MWSSRLHANPYHRHTYAEGRRRAATIWIGIGGILEAVADGAKIFPCILLIGNLYSTL